VRRVVPQPNAFANIRSDDDTAMAYVFAGSGGVMPDAAQGGPGAAIHTLARFFFPQYGAMLEDPATGSATANFGAWCLAMGRRVPLRVQISQGESVGRPSVLHLEIGSGRNIRVGGHVIAIGSGVVTLDSPD